MTKFLLSTVAIAALTTASFAADLPSRKSPAEAPYVAVPMFTWTGFYVGGDIGGAWTNDGSRYRLTPAGVGFAPAGTLVATSSMNSSGVVGGLFAGYNWQFSNAFVVGLEADVEATSLSKNNANILAIGDGFVVPIGFLNSEKLPWQGSARARLGYAAGNALFYVTGGLALAQIQTRYFNADFNTTDSFSQTRAGWTLGGGVEYAFNANWTARIEYRYSQFGTIRDTLTNTTFPAGALAVSHPISENAVRVGIAYKFGAPAAAVVAKY